MVSKAEKGEPFVAEDREFHKILFRCTGNLLLEQLLTAFWELFAKSGIEQRHSDLVKVAIQHKEILGAFARQDLQLLSNLMREQFADMRYRTSISLVSQPHDFEREEKQLPESLCEVIPIP